MQGMLPLLRQAVQRGLAAGPQTEAPMEGIQASLPPRLHLAHLQGRRRRDRVWARGWLRVGGLRGRLLSEGRKAPPGGASPRGSQAGGPLAPPSQHLPLHFLEADGAPGGLYEGRLGRGDEMRDRD